VGGRREDRQLCPKVPSAAIARNNGVCQRERGGGDAGKIVSFAPGFRPTGLRGIMAYGPPPPPQSDELAGQPGSYRSARERSAPRLLRTLPRRGPRLVARPRLHRYAASDLRGSRVSLERRRKQ